MTYKQEVERLAGQYWVARQVECNPESSDFMRDQAIAQRRAVWKRMGEVEPDPLPEWVVPELVELANKLSCKERTARHDLDGSPIVCRGHWPSGVLDEYEIERFIGDGWKLMDLNTSNVLYQHDGLHAVITICEGDLTLDVFQTEDEYRSYLGYTHRFYASR